MVGLSFCDFAGTRDEKVMMAAYRQNEWPRRFKVISNFSFLTVLKLQLSHLWPFFLTVFDVVMRMQNGSHLWPLALKKRKEGRCPLEPGEIAVILRALGYTRETQIYVASGQVYGGKNRMAPLRNMFPNLVSIARLLPKSRNQESSSVKCPGFEAGIHFWTRGGAKQTYSFPALLPECISRNRHKLCIYAVCR